MLDDKTSFSLEGAPYGMQDWRESPRLPRRELPSFPNGHYNRRTQLLTILAVHHAAGTDTVQGINTYHTQVKNWADPGEAGVIHAPHIAYHFFIHLDGTITWCNQLWERVWHATNANDTALGVCLNGNCDVLPPRPAQLEALAWLLARLLSWRGLAHRAIWGHGELTQFGNATSCPGRFLLPTIQAWRQQGLPRIEQKR